MSKIKKIHKIIFFFILIFLIGLYSFSIYIDTTIDKKDNSAVATEIETDSTPTPEAVQLNE